MKTELSEKKNLGLKKLSHQPESAALGSTGTKLKFFFSFLSYLLFFSFLGRHHECSNGLLPTSFLAMNLKTLMGSDSVKRGKQ